jgi:hypothetical protein
MTTSSTTHRTASRIGESVRRMPSIPWRSSEMRVRVCSVGRDEVVELVDQLVEPVDQVEVLVDDPLGDHPGQVARSHRLLDRLDVERGAMLGRRGR